ncbi:MAG: tRNA pseudouridine(38-40) synthase TruA [Verrucomicrobiota bacterium]|nr:tRNA pseudouridine(38-40) synthase TruA [Verrucomicrobiota bacterium]
MTGVLKYKLKLGYDGTAYSGWQRQKGVLSIQEVVEGALSTFLRHRVFCVAAGRTDAGVHAKGQVVHFQTPLTLSPSKTRYSLNALLPEDIRVFSLEPVTSDFHARYSALSKVYHYQVHLDAAMDPLQRFYRYQSMQRMDLALLRQAIPHFVGTRDFFSFANEGSKGSAARGAVRTLYRLDLIEEPWGIRLEFEGNGFLYKMVRNITGTLLEVGRGKRSPDEMPALFQARDRKRIGIAAPSWGLCLMAIRY